MKYTEQDKYIKLSQALEVLDRCACWWAHELMEGIPAADVVSAGAYDQTDWERCVALTQLKEIGKSFGERMDDVRTIVLCKDCNYWGLSEIEPSFHVCKYLYGAEVVRNEDDFCSRGKKGEES